MRKTRRSLWTLAAAALLLLAPAAPLRAQESSWGSDWEIPSWVKTAAKDYLKETRDWDGAYYQIRPLNGSRELRIFWLIPEKDLQAVASHDLIMKLGGDDSLGLVVDPKNRLIVGEYTSAEMLETIRVHVAETRGWPETYYEVKLTPMAGEWFNLWVISKAARKRIDELPDNVVLLGSDGESFGLYIDPRTKTVARGTPSSESGNRAGG